MRILLTHRYFWPDTAPYGLILRQLGEDLADAGHEVTVFTSKPSYGKGLPDALSRAQLGKLNVRRIRVLPDPRSLPLIRVFNMLQYCAALFFHVLGARADVVTAGTFPPVLAGWSASLAARMTGARFIYHVQDIHPELSGQSGGRLGWGLAARLLRWLDNQTLRRADSIVTLSEDMAETLLARGLGDLPIAILNNPPLKAAAPVDPPQDLVKPEGRLRVIFAGNIGRFQNLPLLAEGVSRCFEAHPNLELMFLGDGVALEGLKARWGEHPQVRFAPFLPFDQARAVIAEADIGLVSLSPGLYRVAYPSKLSTYLDLGLTVLALIEPESRMAQMLESTGHGAAAAFPEPEAIAAALERLLSRPRPAPLAEAETAIGTAHIWREIVVAGKDGAK